MKTTLIAIAAAFARQAVSHATFQQLWIDGADQGTSCGRQPQSNTPVTNVNGNEMRCNVGGTKPAATVCAVKAGGTVTVEMHQQPNDRNCKNEPIGGAHYGPIMAYLSKVPDAKTADGSTPFFKIYQNGWSATGGVGDNDNWGVKDMNQCCGRVDVKIPTDIPDGDYLLRAEVIALHSLPAQLYMTCYQITVSGGSGTTVPAGVRFPGAYKSSDPGIAANIHGKLSSYVVPGPAVISGGTTLTPGGGTKTCAAAKGKSKRNIFIPRDGSW